MTTTATKEASRGTPWSLAAEIIDPTGPDWKMEPAQWVSDRAGAFVWSTQREIMESVRDNRYTAVPSCHGPGKSWTAAQIVAWWLDVHPPGRAFAVTTAPTFPQVEAILWREIRATHKRAELPGRTTLDCKWYMGEGDDALVAYGRKPADYDQSAFQGIHARYVLIVVDEAGGVPRSLFDAVDSLATNEFARVLAIGNPDDPTSHFATICKPGSGWNVIRISAFETPNFTGEEIPEDLKHDLVGPTWVEERRKRWGEGSPLWQSKVLGQFPDITDDTLILPKWVEAAHQRWREGTNKMKHRQTGPWSFGVDVARFGADETVIYLREGGQAWLVHSGHKDDTMKTSGHVARLVREHYARPVAFIDDVGVGGGVVDRLREQNFPVIGYNGGSAPVDKERFKDSRSEQYWNLRERLEKGEIDIDPADDDLASQLLSLKYEVDSRGRIKVESKDDMRKRGLPSPDRADALMYAFLPQVADIGQLIESHTETKTVTGDLMEAGF